MEHMGIRVKSQSRGFPSEGICCLLEYWAVECQLRRRLRSAKVLMDKSMIIWAFPEIRGTPESSPFSWDLGIFYWNPSILGHPLFLELSLYASTNNCDTFWQMLDRTRCKEVDGSAKEAGDLTAWSLVAVWIVTWIVMMLKLVTWSEKSRWSF